MPATGGAPAYRAAGHAALVDAVRSTGATQPLLLGGLDYAGDLSGWTAHAPRDPDHQLIAAEHNYGGLSPCAGGCLAAVLATHRRHPVVFGELGETDCAQGYIDQMMRFADQHGIGYLGWAWDATAPGGWTCAGGPSLITSYAGTPTAFGEGLRKPPPQAGPRPPSRATLSNMSFLDRALRMGEAKKFKSYEQKVSRINGFEAEMELHEDEELREIADDLRERARNGESLDDLLFECFALVREAGKRAMGMRHFDVQLIGGMVLHDGCIAEMKTGEGKTLTATLAVVLNSLPGLGVHVVTVNDYLARRDAMWMKPIYDMLGVTVGILQNMQDPAGEGRRLRRRRHLRHQLRVRL